MKTQNEKFVGTKNNAIHVIKLAYFSFNFSSVKNVTINAMRYSLEKYFCVLRHISHKAEKKITFTFTNHFSLTNKKKQEIEMLCEQ